LKERFNKTGFRLFQKIMELVRKIVSTDPFERIKEQGVLGCVIGRFFDRITEPLIHKMSYRSTSIPYNRKRDKPYKGSAIYTFNYISIKRAVKFIFDIIIVLPFFSFIIQFLTADFITQLRILLGFVPFMLIGWGIYNIIKRFKR